jgi:signal transduction histidine kinase
MRNPKRHMHAQPGVGRRDAPRPASAADTGARLGYTIGNHIRGRCLPSQYGQDRAHPMAAASILGGIQPRLVTGSAISHAMLEDALLLAQSQVRELLAAERRKDEFLALLVHELRSPLTAIGYANGLMGKQMAEGAPDQPLQGLIARQVFRMSELVDEVLDVSRVINGLLSVHRERIDLRVIVANALETLQSDIVVRGQRLSTRLPEVPVWVLGDGRRLEQVFVNLIANASRYTDTGGRLTAWVYCQDGEAVVRIRDSGIGIAPDSLSGIFELFRQGNAADPRSKAGLGVGLALVRQLIGLHDGTVTAASEGVGRGSEFTICLPLLADRLPAAPEARGDQAMNRASPIEPEASARIDCGCA